MVLPRNGTPLSHKKEPTTNTGNNTDGSQRRHAKRRKPDPKDHIPYNLAFSEKSTAALENKSVVVRAGVGEGWMTKGPQEGIWGEMELLCILIVAVVLELYRFVKALGIIQ